MGSSPIVPCNLNVHSALRGTTLSGIKCESTLNKVAGGAQTFVSRRSFEIWFQPLHDVTDVTYLTRFAGSNRHVIKVGTHGYKSIV